MGASETSHEVLEASLLAELVDRLGPVAVMAAVRDDDGTIVDFRYRLVNEAFARTLHEPVEVLVGARLLELYPSHVELGLFDAFCRVVDTGEPYVSELPWFDERNLRAFLEVQVTRFHDGYLLTGRDITEAKLAERVTRIFESSQDGIISIDRSGIITAWNAGAEEMYGYTEADAVGHHISMCAPGELEPPQAALISRVLAGEVPPPFETERRHRDGAPRRVEIAAAPILDDGGRTIGASLVHRDTSERSSIVGPAEPSAGAENGTAAVRWRGDTTLEVEVWSGFSRRWLPGFLVSHVNADGTVRVRRPDGVELPAARRADLVRPATGDSPSSRT